MVFCRDHRTAAQTLRSAVSSLQNVTGPESPPPSPNFICLHDRERSFPVPMTDSPADPKDKHEDCAQPWTDNLPKWEHGHAGVAGY